MVVGKADDRFPTLREIARAAGEELVAAVRGGTPLAEAAAALERLVRQRGAR